MRYLISSVLSVAILFTGPALRASDAMKAIVDSYLEIGRQLGADKVDGLKAPARSIQDQASRLEGGGKDIVKAAQTVERATDLAAAREGFGALSDAVIAAAKAEGWKDVRDVKVAYCPMIKRSWLQKEQTIRNPYEASMRSCGEFRKIEQRP